MARFSWHALLAFWCGCRCTLSQSLLSRLSVPFSALSSLTLELRDDVIRGVERDEKQKSPEILVCLFPNLPSEDIDRRRVSDA